MKNKIRIRISILRENPISVHHLQVYIFCFKLVSFICINYFRSNHSKTQMVHISGFAFFGKTGETGSFSVFDELLLTLIPYLLQMLIKITK